LNTLRLKIRRFRRKSHPSRLFSNQPRDDFEISQPLRLLRRVLSFLIYFWFLKYLGVYLRVPRESVNSSWKYFPEGRTMTSARSSGPRLVWLTILRKCTPKMTWPCSHRFLLNRFNTYLTFPPDSLMTLIWTFVVMASNNVHWRGCKKSRAIDRLTNPVMLDRLFELHFCEWELLQYQVFSARHAVFDLVSINREPSQD
jgi:hypothetical protein